MTSWLRRAGRGRLPDGSTVLWSVAEGSRGRRWREIRRSPRGELLTSLLLETDPGGLFAHLELSTAAGLLTLHPEGDGTLHGNVVAERSLRHVAGLPWTPRSVVLVEGSPLATSAATRSLANDVGPGSSADVAVVRIGADLEVRPGRAAVRRVTAHEWQIGSGGSIEIDPDGLPVLADAETWPLEAE